MKQRRILLAEDDGDDRNFFHDFLRDRDDLLLLPMATNGEEVLEYMELHKANHTALPDAIILDQNMPRQNGLQTLVELKNNPLYAHIPVMIYSTYAEEHLVRKSLEMGAALVFAKPNDRRGYHRMIDHLFAVLTHIDH